MRTLLRWLSTASAIGAIVVFSGIFSPTQALAAASLPGPTATGSTEAWCAMNYYGQCMTNYGNRGNSYMNRNPYSNYGNSYMNRNPYSNYGNQYMRSPNSNYGNSYGYSAPSYGNSYANPARPYGQAAPMPAPQGGQGMVNIQNFMFNPGTITVHVGQQVVWVNNDSAPHTSTSGSCSGGTCTPAPGWDSGTLNPGQSFAFTFTTAGTFTYFCRIHGASLQGTVVVTQ